MSCSAIHAILQYSKHVTSSGNGCRAISSEVRRGTVTAAYTKPQQRKKESERLRGEGDQIKFIDLRFEKW